MAAPPRKPKQPDAQARSRRSPAKKRAAQFTPAQLLELALAGPITGCWVSAGWQRSGMAQIFVMRHLAEGFVAFGAILIDAFCLGGKDGTVQFMPAAEVALMLRAAGAVDRLRPAEPAYARKLAQDAIAWAEDLGFAPRPEALEALELLAGVDADSCRERFSFGLKGQPHYVRGPHETPLQVTQILGALCGRCGPKGFTVEMGPDDDEETNAIADEALEIFQALLADPPPRRGRKPARAALPAAQEVAAQWEPVEQAAKPRRR